VMNGAVCVPQTCMVVLPVYEQSEVETGCLLDGVVLQPPIVKNVGRLLGGLADPLLSRSRGGMCIGNVDASGYVASLRVAALAAL
jgi:hypothetical protein